MSSDEEKSEDVAEHSARDPESLYGIKKGILTWILSRKEQIEVFVWLSQILLVALVLWQVLEMRWQAHDNGEQGAIERRADYLEKIYSCETDEDPNLCTPTHAPRVRREAAIAFVLLEKRWFEGGRTIQSITGEMIKLVDLRRIDMKNASLEGEDLSRANFSWALFQGTNFYSTILAGSRFNEADMTNANFHSADLCNANFFGAILQKARLERADFSHAKLTNASLVSAKLHDADLRTAEDLKLEQLEVACGSPGTKIPSHLERPSHWTSSDVKPEIGEGCPPALKFLEGVDLIVGGGTKRTFKALTEAIKLAGLEDLLNGTHPYTLFAPTDNAFDLLPEILAKDPERLREVLNSHIVPGITRKKNVTATGLELTTISGKKITARSSNNTLQVDQISVLATDFTAANVSIQVIDDFLPGTIP